MKFVVKPTQPETQAKNPITQCWKCSEYPAACGSDI
jgi:hypothetical protein